MEQTLIERAIERAIVSLEKKGIRRHRHGPRCRNLLKHVLYPDEQTILEAKQSYLVSIAPIRIVATKKRLIIVDPSFWGLYTAHDLLGSTDYMIIPYRHIISVTLSKGLIFSSIKIYTSSGADLNSVLKGANEIHGVDPNHARALATFIEEVIEFEEKEESGEKSDVSGKSTDSYSYSRSTLGEGISLEEAKELVATKGAKFVWMGIEPMEDVMRVLGVSKGNIMEMSGSHLFKLSKAEIEKMPPLILISYDGIMAVHTSTQVKKKFGLEPKVLRGGIMAVAASVKDQANEFLK